MRRKPLGRVYVNRQHPLSKGCVGFWAFNEAQGWGASNNAIVIRDACHATHGYYRQAAAAEERWTYGAAGPAWLQGPTINAAGIQFSTIPTESPIALAGRDTYSYVARIGPTAAPRDNAPIFNKGSSRFAAGGHAFALFSGNFYLYVDGSFSGAGGAMPIRDNLHIAAVRRAGAVQFFVDGQPHSSTTISAGLLPPSQATVAGIGNDPAGTTNSKFFGAFYNVSVYARALSNADVLALFKDDYAPLAVGDFFPWFRSQPGAAETELTCEPLTFGWSASEAGVSQELETQLSLDALTLAWASADANVSSTVVLAIDNATLGWAASLVDIAAAGTVSAEPASLAWTSSDVALDVFTAVDGVDSVFNWAASNVDVLPIEQSIDGIAASLGWVAGDVDVIPAGVLGLDALTLGWTAPAVNVLPEEQAVPVENALLAWASTRSGVVDELNLVSPQPGLFAWTATDASIQNEQVTGEPLALAWVSPAVNIFVETAVQHGHLVEVVRPDSLDVMVYSSQRKSRTWVT